MFLLTKLSEVCPSEEAGTACLPPSLNLKSKQKSNVFWFFSSIKNWGLSHLCRRYHIAFNCRHWLHPEEERLHPAFSPGLAALPAIPLDAGTGMFIQAHEMKTFLKNAFCNTVMLSENSALYGRNSLIG